RIDELVDGPNAPHITPEALDRCEASLEDIFNGRLFHLLDAPLSDIVSRFHVDIRNAYELVEILIQQPDELYLYCYYVASTVGLMSVRIWALQNQRQRECVYATAVGFDRGCRVMNSFVHSLPMLLGPFKIMLGVGNPNFVFEGKTIQRMEPLVLTTLKWRMLAYTPCTYIDYFVGAIACSYETYKAKLLGVCGAAMNHLVPQDELARGGSQMKTFFFGR
ncbi:hypothetical protein H5410_003880, partial [Solanum commersonii]